MKHFFTTINRNSVRAFTLLEVLASFTIVTMVILGPLSFSVNSASYSRQSKDVLTSEYLAQEALELLHNQYDTLYIECAHNKGPCEETINPTLSGETSGSKAWRTFKTRLDDTTDGAASCFDTGGCTYDLIDMLDTTTVTPPPKRYVPVSNICSGLAMVYSVVAGYDPDMRNYYVCSGIDTSRLKDDHFKIKQSAYTRKITITSVPTFTETGTPIPASPPANIGLYQDDLVVTATVSFRRSNGVIREIKVVDLIHARS